MRDLYSFWMQKAAEEISLFKSIKLIVNIVKFIYFDFFINKIYFFLGTEERFIIFFLGCRRQQKRGKRR